MAFLNFRRPTVAVAEAPSKALMADLNFVCPSPIEDGKAFDGTMVSSIVRDSWSDRGALALALYIANYYMYADNTAAKKAAWSRVSSALRGRLYKL